MCSCVTVSMYFIVRDRESPYNINLCFIYGCRQILSWRRWMCTPNKNITEDSDTNISGESLAINNSHALCQISKYNFVSRIQFMILVSLVYFSSDLSCRSDSRNDSIEKIWWVGWWKPKESPPIFCFGSSNIYLYIWKNIFRKCVSCQMWKRFHVEKIDEMNKFECGSVAQPSPEWCQSKKEYGPCVLGNHWNTMNGVTTMFTISTMMK